MGKALALTPLCISRSLSLRQGQSGEDEHLTSPLATRTDRKDISPMKRTRFLMLPALALLLLIGLLGLGSQRLGLVHALGTTVPQVTNCNDSGPGSLRDTLASAASGSIITFSLSCDIKLKSTLTVSKTLTLDGSGYQVTLDGQQAVQVLLVPSGVTFTLKTLAIANGSSDSALVNNSGTVNITNSTVSNSGDGIDNSGGTLRITNSTISNTFTGLSNSSGKVTITNSTISGNSVTGLSNGGTMTITNSTISGNSNSSEGDAGLSNSGTASITNSTVSDNFFDGIDNIYGTLRITNSTVSGNSFYGNSGIFTESDGISGTASITNSTVSGNLGDGIDHFGGTLRITNSTVSGNSFAGIGNIAGHTVLRGSIVANNPEGNCFIGAVTDQGDNLSSDTSCDFTASTSLQNTDPKLDPAGLHNNGGPTQTIALQPDSPAVDRIPVGSNCPAIDQRGVTRPQGPNCDSGALEMTAADGLTVMIHVVNRFHLAKSLQTSLDQQVQTVLADLRARQTAQACQDLTSFINHVQAQSGIGLTTTQATQLLQEAAVIHTRLGC
jgi:hypothetical protein